MLVCDYCRCAIVTLADGVVEEANEFGGQYRESEPKDPYREPELRKALRMTSSISSFDVYFVLVL